MKFRPFCRQTGIGSLPHIDAERAKEVILKNCPEIPHLPLLPKRSFKESSAIYCTEGMPCLIIDEEKKHFYFDTRGDITPALEKFYERYLSQDLNHFAFSAEYASGYHAMLRELAVKSPPSIKIIKGQITGPITLGLRLLDQDHKPIYYNEAIRDTIEALANLSSYPITVIPGKQSVTRNPGFSNNSVRLRRTAFAGMTE